MKKVKHPNEFYDMDKIQQALLAKGFKCYTRYEKICSWVMAACALALFIICKGVFK